MLMNRMIRKLYPKAEQGVSATIRRGRIEVLTEPMGWTDAELAAAGFRLTIGRKVLGDPGRMVAGTVVTI